MSTKDWIKHLLSFLATIMSTKDWIRHLLSFLVYATCLVVFLLQAHQEVDKYFSRLTAIALHTINETNISFPNLVVCSKRPLKNTDDFVLTYEDYEAAVFSFDEIFNNDTFHPQVLNELRISSVDTIRFRQLRKNF